MPIEGIGPYPKINNGFKKIFKKKLNIRTFLNDFVSPSACKRELRATTEIKIIDPENITFVYFKPKFITSLVEPIKEKIFDAKKNPINVTIKDKTIP
tara:strand:- start:51 stop:341 length:291 start_codon:yes stop_codon:yes gene_type:complete